MELIDGASPRFRAPKPGWRIAPIPGRTPPTGPTGILDLRVGYCRGPASKTIAEAAVAIDGRERAGDPVATKGDLRSSLVPVVLVDGEPVAAGWGRIALPLPAGRHLVAVQSQHSRTWRACEIEAGATTALDYIGMLGDGHRAYGLLADTASDPNAVSAVLQRSGDPGAGPGAPQRSSGPGTGASGAARGLLAGYTGHTLGPRGRLEFWQYLPANARGRRSFHLFLLALVIGVVCSLLLTSFGVGAAVALLSGAAVWSVALAGWAVRVLWTTLRFNRGEPEAALKTPEALLQVQGSGLCTGFGHVVRPAILDPAGPLPELGPGAAAILVDARFVKADLTSAELALQLPQGQSRISGAQRRALDDLGEVVPIRHRFAVPPPELTLADADADADAVAGSGLGEGDPHSEAGATRPTGPDGRARADGEAEGNTAAPIAATWTRMWIEVPPGSHRLTVRTPDSPMPLSGPAEPAETRSATVNLEAGQVARVDLAVEVTAVPDPAEPLLHRWHCRIDRLGPASAAEARPAPRADVRGSLRRALTGRYWERPDR